MPIPCIAGCAVWFGTSAPSDSDDSSARRRSKGYDPQFGARPLKRAIQEHLLDPLATKLLAGEFRPGEKIKVGANGDSLTFKVK